MEHDEIKLISLGTHASGKTTWWRHLAVLADLDALDQSRNQPEAAMWLWAASLLCTLDDILAFNEFDEGAHKVAYKHDNSECCSLLCGSARKLVSRFRPADVVAKLLVRSEGDMTFFPNWPSVWDIWGNSHCERSCCLFRWVKTGNNSLLFSQRTTGIHEIEILMTPGPALSLCRCVDLGGARSERKTWAHSFQDLSGVMFFCSAASVNRVLWETSYRGSVEHIWDIDETLRLYQDLRAAKWFTTNPTPFYVVITQVDVLERDLLAGLNHTEASLGKRCESAEQVVTELIGRLHSAPCNQTFVLNATHFCASWNMLDVILGGRLFPEVERAIYAALWCLGQIGIPKDIRILIARTAWYQRALWGQRFDASNIARQFFKNQRKCGIF